ncbi:hypothetical protein H9I45_01850 [Polaribacter haliotis]|uniref:Uncharacterized protein n=1 Tax=Polaribacter haliotis TaxID=1888915 RepID=A0A7L8AGS2_9FLAO|nr:hypothetical protein [Polaribacter haliotis]QOD61215.1 hypothetical protein H9I45_01850 [Polaribacter haliotis]
MKKVILTLAFVAGITSLNANTNNEIINPTDCHAEACEYLGFVEEYIGEMSEAEAEAHYQVGYNECMGNE